jgi:hypothetical protein
MSEQTRSNNMKHGLQAIIAFLSLIFLTASHPVKSEAAIFWYGHLTWQGRGEAGEYLADLDFLAGFGGESLICIDPLSGQEQACTGANGLPGVGDTIRGPDSFRLDFGDGSQTSQLLFKVLAVYPTEGWVLTRAFDPLPIDGLISHRYAEPGPFTASVEVCCRPDSTYTARVWTEIDFNLNASGPVSVLPPIVDCALGRVCEFTITSVDPDAIDPERPNVQVRFPRPSETGDRDFQQPEKATLIGNKYVWNAGYAAQSGLHPTQVVLEERIAGGQLVGTTSIDFILRIRELVTLSDDDQIGIPVRWCVLANSPSVIDPGQLGQMTVAGVLRERLAKVNAIFLPQANLGFFLAGRPIIIENGPGQSDVPDPVSEGVVIHHLVNDCRMAWRRADPTVTGILAVQINRFDGADQLLTDDVIGHAGVPPSWDSEFSGDVGRQALHAFSTIIDGAYLVGEPAFSLTRPLPNPDPIEKWLAHEFGHALSLPHVFESDNLMDNYNRNAIALNSGQVETIREQAVRFIPDVVINPEPGVLQIPTQ